jgi:hypothetical protein
MNSLEKLVMSPEQTCPCFFGEVDFEHFSRGKISCDLWIIQGRKYAVVKEGEKWTVFQAYQSETDRWIWKSIRGTSFDSVVGKRLSLKFLMNYHEELLLKAKKDIEDALGNMNRSYKSICDADDHLEKTGRDLRDPHPIDFFGGPDA